MNSLYVKIIYKGKEFVFDSSGFTSEKELREAYDKTYGSFKKQQKIKNELRDESCGIQ